MKDFDNLNNRQRFNKVDDRSNSKQQQEKKKRHSPRWTKLSKLLRNRWTLCQYPGCEYPSDSVHHIRSAYHYTELFFVTKNLIPLCKEHHTTCDHQSKEKDRELSEYWEKIVDEYYKNRSRFA